MPVNYSHFYRRFIPTAHRLLLDRVVASKAGLVVGKTLVIGAGNINYEKFFPNASEVINSDIERYGEHISVLLDAEKICFADCQFDSVVAFEVLEHLRDPGAVCNEILRILKPGGHFYFSVPFLFRIHGDPSDYQRFTLYGLESLLEGFSRCNITGYGGRLAVISDLITTTCKPFAALRLFNFMLRFLPIGSSSDSPSGYFAVADKAEQTP